MFGFRDEFLYFQCSNCDCLQIAEVPTNFRDYYPANYYSFQEVTAEITHGGIRNFFRIKRNEAALLRGGLLGKVLCKVYPFGQKTGPIDFDTLRDNISFKSKILDVGCGNGGLLHDLHFLGFKYLFGIDPFNGKETASDNPVRIGKMAIHDVDEVFDLIMFHHSFEHMPDPFETLAKVPSILSSNGICLIRIPVVPSYAWAKYGVNWVQLDAPRHLFLHSIKSMALLLEKAGLRLRRIIFDSTEFQFWGSEQYMRNIPLRSENSYGAKKAVSNFSLSEIDEFRNRAKHLNTNKWGDQAAFYISK